MHLWILAPVVFVVACLFTWLLRRYALARSLLDIPSARSSHRLPTPRGGGVAFVIAWLCALPVAASLGWLSWSLTCGLVGAGVGSQRSVLWMTMACLSRPAGDY